MTQVCGDFSSSVLLSSSGSCKTTCVPIDSPLQMHTQTALSGLSGFKNGSMKMDGNSGKNVKAR